jgi:hypothetical protein
MFCSVMIGGDVVDINRILFITPYSQGFRGNVTTTLRITGGYTEQGIQVSVFAYAEGGT